MSVSILDISLFLGVTYYYCVTYQNSVFPIRKRHREKSAKSKKKNLKLIAKAEKIENFWLM